MSAATRVTGRSDLLQRARKAFTSRFGRPPAYAAAAPGRVNLIGEHTDYNDGFVLPMAIDRYAVIVAAPTEEDHSTLVAQDLRQVARADLVGDFEPVDKPFANYFVGMAYQYWLSHADLKNLDLLVTSSIPIGSGLASSAALTVAMSYILEQLTSLELDPTSRAEACRLAEHDYAETPCGIMDMLISIRAEAGHAMLVDCRSVQAQPIALPGENDLSILVVDTGIAHTLARTEYPRRRAICEGAARRLGVTALRDVTHSMLENGALTEEERRAAHYVVEENKRVLLAASDLRDGKLDAFGRLLFESHEAQRHEYLVSCAELDAIVDAAKQLHEQGIVFGARMTGGGFGGCAIVLCPSAHERTVTDEITRRYAATFGRPPAIMPVRAVDGASAMPLSPTT